MNKHIAQFLNNEANYKALSRSKINSDKSFNEDLDKEFSRKLLLSDNINEDAYTYLVKSVLWYYNNLNISGLSENKIDVLLKEKTVRLSANNLRYLVKSETEKYLDLIETDIDEFLKIKPDLDFLPLGLFSKLISSTSLNKDEKEKILRKLDEEQVLNNLLASEEEFAFAVSKYLMVHNVTISFEFLDSLFDKVQDTDRKIKILINLIQGLDKNQIHSLLTKTNDLYASITPTGYNVSLLKSTLNISLAEALENVRYISSSKIKKEKVQLFLKH